jgi:hypothetical protein
MINALQIVETDIGYSANRHEAMMIPFAYPSDYVIALPVGLQILRG